MTGLARLFMILAVLSALIGMGWGIQMSASGDHFMMPAHAHLNLLGYVSFALFALYYHAVPAAAVGILPKVHFALAVVGLIVIVPGIVMALKHVGDVAAKIGSIMTVLNMLVFGIVVLRSPRM